MKYAIRATAICLLGVAAALFPPATRADEHDKLTKVTFSGPVEIPGQVLPAGTYWFRLLGSQSNRNIVQIYNEGRTKQIAMIMAIPDYRVQPTGKPVITFEERAANSPEAVKAWFAPGDNYGQEFVYPKPRAAQLAKASNQPVPSMPANLEANTRAPVKSEAEPPAVALKQAPVTAQQPTGEEVEIGQVVQTPPELLAQNTPAPSPAKPEPAPNAERQLPATASAMPVAGLVGLILLALAIVIRFAAKTVS